MAFYCQSSKVVDNKQADKNNSQTTQERSIIESKRESVDRSLTGDASKSTQGWLDLDTFQIMADSETPDKKNIIDHCANALQKARLTSVSMLLNFNLNKIRPEIKSEIKSQIKSDFENLRKLLQQGALIDKKVESHRCNVTYRVKVNNLRKQIEDFALKFTQNSKT